MWWQTVIATMVGGVLTAAGASYVWWQQERVRRRDGEARAVAAALSALRELNPLVYADRLRNDKRGWELIADKRERWLGAAGGLDTVAAQHPDTEIEKLCESIIRRGNLLLIRLDEMVGATTDPSDAWLKAIPPHYDDAMAEVRALVRLIR